VTPRRAPSPTRRGRRRRCGGFSCTCWRCWGAVDWRGIRAGAVIWRPAGEGGGWRGALIGGARGHQVAARRRQRRAERGLGGRSSAGRRRRGQAADGVRTGAGAGAGRGSWGTRGRCGEGVRTGTLGGVRGIRRGECREAAADGGVGCFITERARGEQTGLFARR
jgi:hypothetical protein